MKEFIGESKEVKEKPIGRKDTVTLVFRENRSFDLHISGIVYRFVGRESKIVPASVITSPDFNDQIRELFLVKEA